MSDDWQREFLRPSDVPQTFEEHLSASGFLEATRIGEGGFGHVYIARDARVPRYLAIKRLKETVPRDVRARISQEATVLSLFKHPGIVGFITSGEFHETPYIVMELIGDPATIRTGNLGGFKARTLRDLRPGVQESAGIAASIAEALAFVHAKHLVHRDLKPENILVRPDGTPVLVDFGLVHYARKQGDPKLPAGLLSMARAGTLNYQAPEQINSVSELTEATDQWALGVVLYELLTRRLPFTLSDNEPVHLIESRITDAFFEIRRPRQCNQDIPEHLEAICMQCLSRDPAKRYPSIGDLAKDLRQYLETGLSLAGIKQQGPAARAISSIALKTRKHRLTVRALLVAVAAAALVQAGHWILLSRESPSLYEDWTYQWGVPKGINPVTGLVAQKRFSTYRVLKRGLLGPVIRCECINFKGRLSPDSHDDRAAILEVYYDRAPGRSNRVDYILFKDWERNEGYSRRYSYHEDGTHTITFEDRGKPGLLGRRLGISDASKRKGYRVVLDVHGFEGQHLFVSQSTNAPDAAGVWGWRYKYDPNREGRRILEYPLVADFSVPGGIAFTNWVPVIENFYDANGRLSGRAFRGQASELVNVPDDYGLVKPGFFHWDQSDLPVNGRTAPQSLVKSSSNNTSPPAEPSKAKLFKDFCLATNRYDRFGNLTGKALFRADGRAAITGAGYEVRVYDPNDPGRRLEQQYLSANGEIIKRLADRYNDTGDHIGSEVIPNSR